ncbi:uncharacterized protein LOC143174310 [Nomia melanderi]|uniref:uncharacterized protein LOC143174310 n=1 Tax=Nomia melanderi TaxID=2448451 RepID=UPI003FCC71C0
MNGYPRSAYHTRYRGRYFCDVCGKEYTWKPSLMRHKREECGLHRKLVCESCGKSYKWRESLQQHRRLECGIEPQFGCLFCGWRFKHKHHLKQHLMRRHQCDLSSLSQ